jgi:hypothetical protein
MPWYVFALVDEPPARPGAGLSGRLSARAVPGGFAIVERRADVPPIEFDTLNKHDQILARLARDVHAILPVRFGTLLELDEIEEALGERDEEIADALAAVRDRVQFTWRRSGPQARAATRGPRKTAAGRSKVSGTEYLRQAAARSAPPAAFRGVREKLRPLVAAERFQPAGPSLPDSLYHLVDRGAVERYRLIAGRLAATTPVLAMSGPFAPFAFTPDLL